MRVLYLWGDEVKYVVRNSVAVDQNGFVTFSTNRANTSMIIVQLNFTALGLKTLVGSYLTYRKSQKTHQATLKRSNLFP